MIIYLVNAYIVSHPKEIKYKMTFIPVGFNFKTKKVEIGDEMTTEIMEFY
jgi:hypothetical protein